MSSNDRYNRSSRQRQEPAPAEPRYDDEVLYEDEWDIDGGAVQSPTRPQAQPNPRQSQPVRSRTTPGAPTVDGTAAQIDRLRRNIRQSTRPPAQPSPAQVSRRPSRQTFRQAPVEDDQIVQDETYVDDQVYRQAPQPSPARSRSNSVPSRRQPAAQTIPEEAYDEGAYDADPYADYDEFEDDFSEYDAPRRPARRARPKPRFTMPAMSRPSMPPAIARADLVNDAPALGLIGASLASLATMAIVVANQLESLAPEFATHVSASGILESFRDEAALWNVPLMAGMFTLMNIVMAWFISPLDRFASRFVLVGALVAQFVAWVAIIRIL